MLLRPACGNPAARGVPTGGASPAALLSVQALASTSPSVLTLLERTVLLRLSTLAVLCQVGVASHLFVLVRICLLCFSLCLQQATQASMLLPHRKVQSGRGPPR